MSKPHRIAAGGLIFRDDAILLVRYPDGHGGTYLVGPGGALQEHENGGLFTFGGEKMRVPKLKQLIKDAERMAGK